MGSPYEYRVLWDGVSTIVDEIAEQLPPDASPPSAIVCSVGGGSLLAGILLGCEKHSWENSQFHSRFKAMMTKCCIPQLVLSL